MIAAGLDMALNLIIISVSTYEPNAIPGPEVEGLVILWEGDGNRTDTTENATHKRGM